MIPDRRFYREMFRSEGRGFGGRCGGSRLYAFGFGGICSGCRGGGDDFGGFGEGGHHELLVEGDLTVSCKTMRVRVAHDKPDDCVVKTFILVVSGRFDELK